MSISLTAVAKLVLVNWIRNRVRKAMLKKLKEKLFGLGRSATGGVSVGIIGLGVWIQSNPDALVVLGSYQGVGLALVGLAVAIARMRTSDT